jgi:uncharacterized protein YkwD
MCKVRRKTILAVLLLASIGLGPEYGLFSVPPVEGASRQEHGRRHRARGDNPERMQRQPQAQILNYALGVINLSNSERRKAGLRELGTDNELMAAAAQRAQEIERRFEHTRPNGKNFDTVFREFSVRSYNWWGENILYNSSDDPADALKWWMNSSGHRANILGRQFTHIGVGVHRSGGMIYVVQLVVGR